MQFLANSRHIAQVWLALARASLVREMEFRVNFLLGLVRQVLWLGVFIIFIKALFAQADSLAGWSEEAVLIILALSRVTEGLMNMFFIQNLMTFTRTVNKGEFDYYLLRPVPVQLFTAFRYVKFDNIGNILAGISLLGYALWKQSFVPSFLDIAFFTGLVVTGVLIYYCLLVLVASLVFTFERLESLWGFNHLFSEPLTVPFDVFPGRIKTLLTFLVPIAFVVYFPAQALTGRLNWWLVPIGTGMAALFLLLANIAWRAGLRRYSSASS